jgi:hypothetical protein
VPFRENFWKKQSKPAAKKASKASIYKPATVQGEGKGYKYYGSRNKESHSG